MPDPVNTMIPLLNIAGGAAGLLGQIHAAAVAAGWLVDQYDTFPSGDAGGAELYIHTNTLGFSQQSYYSIKVFAGQHTDQSCLAIYANTGYDSTKRVDNQPGMFARSYGAITNAVSVTDVFNGLWDGAGINAYPGDSGRYQTAAFPAVGPTPTVATNVPFLNCPLITTIDKAWIFYDQVASLGSRSLTVLWYTGQQFYGFSIGKVHYDNEGVSPDNVDGTLLAMWVNKFDDRNTTQPPHNNAVGGTRTGMSATDAPIALIRNRTVGAVTWPGGSPNGNPMMACGTVVKSNDRIEANDGAALTGGSYAIRPELGFNSYVGNLTDVRFPNPRLVVHKESYGGQQRVALSRQRAVSRYPDGGSIFGIDGFGGGPTDWSDSRYFFPWYVACTLGESEGSTITNGTRQYRVFPGNRGGVDLFASHRIAGLAFRVA